MTESTPWFHNGLRFRCTQCGNCCTGGPGFIWVTEEEMQSIADFRGISIGEMKIHHTRLFAGQVTLRDYGNGDCTFFDGESRKCTIYPVRPAQCRTWPFWNSNLESPENWQKTSNNCPGIGNGDLVQLETIVARAAAIDL